MKKKMMVIGTIVIVAVAVFMAGWYILFCYMGIGPAFPLLSKQEISTENLQIQQAVQGGMIAEEELMSLVETEEEAQSIAEQYGIEFVSFSDGVAVYTTDEDPAEVISRGEENGYPPLYLNMTRTTMISTD